MGYITHFLIKLQLLLHYLVIVTGLDGICKELCNLRNRNIFILFLNKVLRLVEQGILYLAYVLIKGSLLVTLEKRYSTSLV